jgi:hypothetical protein
VRQLLRLAAAQRAPSAEAFGRHGCQRTEGVPGSGGVDGARMSERVEAVKATETIETVKAIEA